MCWLISREDLPLCFGESDAFEEYIKVVHNPRFASISRQTTTRDFGNYFNDSGGKLIESLQSVSSAALASDI